MCKVTDQLISEKGLEKLRQQWTKGEMQEMTKKGKGFVSGDMSDCTCVVVFSGALTKNGYEKVAGLHSGGGACVRPGTHQTAIAEYVEKNKPAKVLILPGGNGFTETMKEDLEKFKELLKKNGADEIVEEQPNSYFVTNRKSEVRGCETNKNVLGQFNNMKNMDQKQGKGCSIL
jgi:hypothetical protein